MKKTKEIFSKYVSFEILKDNNCKIEVNFVLDEKKAKAKGFKKLRNLNLKNQENGDQVAFAYLTLIDTNTVDLNIEYVDKVKVSEYQKYHYFAKRIKKFTTIYQK